MKDGKCHDNYQLLKMNFCSHTLLNISVTVMVLGTPGFRTRLTLCCNQHYFSFEKGSGMQRVTQNSV
jgi:hypothetical protein